MIKQTTLLAASALSALAMHTAEININNKDAEGSVRFDIAQFNAALEPESYMLGLRVINGHEDHSDLPNTDPIIEANFLLQNPLKVNNNLIFGIGVKAVYTDLASGEYVAMPLGVEVQYRLPLTIDLPVHVGGVLYYAPEVLSFGDADNYFEYRLTADVEVVKNGSIIGGYRQIETDANGAGITYNHGLYVGFKFAF